LLDVVLPIPQQMVKPADVQESPEPTAAKQAVAAIVNRINGHATNGVGHG